MENQAPATSMGSQMKQIPRKYLIWAYFFVGLLYVIGVPLAFYSYPVVNYNVIAIGVIFGLIIIGAAVWDWMDSKSMRRDWAPYLILILGIISIFLFSYTFSTPWVGTYHLYIFDIDQNNMSSTYIPSYVGGAANPAEYNVQNYVTAISTMGGLILALTALYEIFGVVRKKPTM